MKTAVLFVLITFMTTRGLSQDSFIPSVMKNIAIIQNELHIFHANGLIGNSFLIVAETTLAAITYGITHDQITSRVCFEYFFTGSHYPIVDSESPTLHALIWGVIATWWVGFGLGIPTAIFAQAGYWPVITASELLPFIYLHLKLTAFAATIVGFSSWVYMKASGYIPTEFIPNLLTGNGYLLDTIEKKQNWLSVALTHDTSYFFGFLNSVLMWSLIMYERYKYSLNTNKSITSGSK